MKKLPVYNLDVFGVEKDDVFIQRFAPYIKAHHKLLIPHGHSFYHIVCFTKGNGTHTIDFDQFDVKPFQIYFMAPGQVHNWNFQDEVDGYVLNFSDSFFQSFLLRSDYLDYFYFLQGIAKDGVLDIPNTMQGSIERIFEEMLVLNGSVTAIMMDRLRVLILQLFYYISDIENDKINRLGSSYNETLLRNFKKLIDQNFITLRFPKQYADLLYITPNHLNALCSDSLGLSAGDLIRNRVVLEAKRRLVDYTLSVSNIADQLNFKDNSYFTKFFKKQAGFTPEEFRKHILVR